MTIMAFMLVVIINGSIRLLEKAGIVNEVKTIQATIDELRADSKKGLLETLVTTINELGNTTSLHIVCLYQSQNLHSFGIN